MSLLQIQPFDRERISDFSICWRVRNNSSNWGRPRGGGIAAPRRVSRSLASERATTSTLMCERRGSNAGVSTLPIRYAARKSGPRASRTGVSQRRAASSIAGDGSMRSSVAVGMTAGRYGVVPAPVKSARFPPRA
jgi:hypothetical protein